MAIVQIVDVRTAPDSGSRSRRADRVTAIALLAPGLVVALVGWYAVWLVVGLLTTSSGGMPLCAAGEAFLIGVPVAAFVLLVLGTVLVGVRWRRGRTVWGTAAATLGGVVLTYGAFAVIAVTVGRRICM
jgi:hypothetical protein